MALKTADFGDLLEVARIVMEDTCAALMEKEDIKECCQGIKEERARPPPLEEKENLALNTSRPETVARQGFQPFLPGQSDDWIGGLKRGRKSLLGRQGQAQIALNLP